MYHVKSVRRAFHQPAPFVGQVVPALMLSRLPPPSGVPDSFWRSSSERLTTYPYPSLCTHLQLWPPLLRSQRGLRRLATMSSTNPSTMIPLAWNAPSVLCKPNANGYVVPPSHELKNQLVLEKNQNEDCVSRAKGDLFILCAEFLMYYDCVSCHSS